MSTILIEKYVDGIAVEQLRLPTAPLQFLAGLLPGQAHRALQRKGLDVNSLLNDATRTQWLEVTEANVAKRVRISRID
jgi:hypothetical protein